MPSRSRERFRWRAAVVVAAIGWAIVARGATDSARQIEAIYQPFRVAQGSLAPDGERVAFLVRDRGRFEVEVFETGDLLKRRRVPLRADGAASPAFFAWATPRLLVVAFEPSLIVTIDAQTGDVRTLVHGKTFSAVKGRRHVLRPLMLVNEPDRQAVQLVLELTTINPEESSVALDLVRLDLRTETREISSVRTFGWPGGEVLVDRQGQPRLLRSRAEATQRFLLASGSPRALSWRPLDRICAEPAPLKFFVRPDNFLGEHSVPLGFDADPDLLYFASNVGRDTRGVFALNVRSGRRTDFAVTDPELDLVDARLPWGGSPLVFDRASGVLVGLRSEGAAGGAWWLDREIRAVEAALQRKFPARQIQAIDWDDERSRFLVWIGHHGDPGRYFVYDRATERCTEYFRRHADLATADLNPAEPFACAAGPGQGTLHGYLTRPRAAAGKKTPLVIWLHDGPGLRSPSGFNRDTQALAAMGFVVAQVDYAGSGGRGLSWQHATQDRPDEAPLENLATVIRWLASRELIDDRRVAVVGEGLGGYLALRALETRPGLLRSAVAINAPIDLADLARDRESANAARESFTAEAMSRVGRVRPTATEEIEAQRDNDQAAFIGKMMSEAERAALRPIDFQREVYSWYLKPFKNLRDASVLPQAERIVQPVLLLHDPAQRYAPIAAARALQAGLQRRKQPAALAEIPPQFALGELEAREKVVRRIGEFLNVTLHDFEVRLGETTEVK